MSETPPLTDAEIAGMMGWRGPGAYTQQTLRKIRRIIDAMEQRHAAAMDAALADLRGELWEERRQHDITRGVLERARMARDKAMADLDALRANSARQQNPSGKGRPKGVPLTNVLGLAATHPGRSAPHEAGATGPGALKPSRPKACGEH